MSDSTRTRRPRRDNAPWLVHTMDEAATTLGLSRQRMYQLVAEAKIKSFLIGRSRRISRTELDRFIAESEGAK